MKKFFKSVVIPLSPETTVEVYGFMRASTQSDAIGKPVRISDVVVEAQKFA